MRPAGPAPSPKGMHTTVMAAERASRIAPPARLPIGRRAVRTPPKPAAVVSGFAAPLAARA